MAGPNQVARRDESMDAKPRRVAWMLTHTVHGRTQQLCAQGERAGRAAWLWSRAEGVPDWAAEDQRRLNK